MLAHLFLLRRPFVRLQCWHIEHEPLFELDYELFVERLLVGQNFISLLELFLLVLNNIVDIWSGEKKFSGSPRKENYPRSCFPLFHSEIRVMVPDQAMAASASISSKSSVKSKTI
jgi:hypothetical protein